MEIIFLLIIILVYCLILDVNLNYILLGVVALIGIFSALFTLVFLLCDICLLFSKRKEARFIRMGYIKNSKYQVAYYLVEGKEYPCMFPQEGILQEILYNKDKTYHVMLNVKMGKVFDRFAIATSILGVVFGALTSVGIMLLLF